jgi:hypothetical protein
VSRQKGRNPGGASVDPRLPKLSGRARKQETTVTGAHADSDRREFSRR